MIDSTAVRATRASSGEWEKGADEPADHALGRNRGGLTTKAHLLCDADGEPLRFLLSDGQASDISYTPALAGLCQHSDKPTWPSLQTLQMVAGRQEL